MKSALPVCAVLALLLSCNGPAVDKTAVPSAPPESGIHPTVAWIRACRVDNGGFGCFPGDSAFTSRTGMALEALAALGALDSLDAKDELIAWLKARQQPDGGFIEADDYYKGKTLPWKSISALEPTYWAVRALALLNAAPERPVDAAEFVRARLKANGGYDAYEYAWGGAPEALYTTFWALGALKGLGLAVPDSARTVEWVRSQQRTRDGRGGFVLSNDYFNYSSAAGTYFGVAALSLLGAAPERPEGVRGFLLSSFGQEKDGGFELGHGDGWNNYDHYSRMHDTFCAVEALALTGQPLSDSDTSRATRPATDCAAWIASCQNTDGGFGRFGVTDQTPLLPASEMLPTWAAVMALSRLGATVPRPVDPVSPVREFTAHDPLHRHPVVDHSDPCEVQAYRRLALPVYEHFLKQTGNRLDALAMVNRWARAAVGPENGAWLTGGRGILMHGWGQCGAMSWMLQGLLTSIDYASRGSFVIGDVNCEVLVPDESGAGAHWCVLIPFTNEIPDPAAAAADGSRNGWSALDVAVDYRLRKANLNYPSRTRLGDHLFNSVRIETIDDVNGAWGTEYALDSLTTYNSPVVEHLYPGGSY